MEPLQQPLLGKEYLRHGLGSHENIEVRYNPYKSTDIQVLVVDNLMAFDLPVVKAMLCFFTFPLFGLPYSDLCPQ